MSNELVQLRKPSRKRVSLRPFGLGFQKPRHFLGMLGVLWANRRHLLHAWRVLTRGVCDGCALGTSGLRDWTLKGTHLCMVRLGLLELNTLDAAEVAALADAEKLRSLNARQLRAIGRIPYPMRRKRGERGFTRVSWDEVWADLGPRVAAADKQRVAMFMTSRGITNEVYYAAQKAMRYLGSPHIDNAARLCHSPSTAAMKRTLGVAASTCSYRDWYGSDVVVFFGSNPANDQPVAVKYLDEAKRLGTKVLVVNTYEEPGMKRYWVPSTTDSALFGTQIADDFFKVQAGGDLAFVQAVQRLLIERGQVDQAFIDAHTEGFEDYRQQLLDLDLDTLIAHSGASRQDVERFADWLGPARTGVFVWSMGLTQHSHGSDTVAAVCCLGLSKGFVGRDQCGLMPIRGHSGVQGGAEMGAYATSYPGGKTIDDSEADRLQQLWGFRPPVQVGLDTVGMVRAAQRGELDVFYVMGGNLRDTLPQPAEVDEALSRVPVRIHQDIVLTHPMLAEPGEVVYLLPARTRYEHRGGVTETTTERRVIFSPYIAGHEVGDSREEWWIPLELARAVDPDRAELLGCESADAIRQDIGRVIDSYRGIDQLKAQGDQFQWGGRHLCAGGQFPLPGGKARFEVTRAPDRRLPQGQFHLTTRRGKQFNSIIQSEHDALTGADRDHIFISAQDMQHGGWAADQAVQVVSEHGRLRGRLFQAPITPGTLQMHWPEANVLISAQRLDPGGLVPDYNAVVRLEAA